MCRFFFYFCKKKGISFNFSKEIEKPPFFLWASILDEWINKHSFVYSGVRLVFFYITKPQTTETEKSDFWGKTQLICMHRFVQLELVTVAAGREVDKVRCCNNSRHKVCLATYDTGIQYSCFYNSHQHLTVTI